MQFKDVLAQDFIINKLKKNIDNNRIAHSQLFEGKNGYGLLPITISYLQYLNCKNRIDGDSCGICPSCKKISKLEHPDINFIFPVNKSKKAENISKTDSPISDNFISKFREYSLNRELPLYIDEKSWYDAIELDNKNSQPIINKKEADAILEKLSYKPIESQYITFVIWLPERLNDSAANTLLKQFEEPVNSALFIFLSEDSSKIIKTILSRTQLTTIPPINSESIFNILKNKFTDKDENDLKIISKLSNGDIIKSFNLCGEELNDSVSFDLFKELMRACYQNNHLKLFDWVDSFSELDRGAIKEFFMESIDLFRSSYFETINVKSLNTSYSFKREFLNNFHPFINNSNIESLIENFEIAYFQITRNGNIKIIMTHFVLNITKLINKNNI